MAQQEVRQSVETEHAEGAGDVLWVPTPDDMAAAPIAAFTAWVRRHRGLDLADYDAVWRWSTGELEGFWGALWEFHEVGVRDPDEVLPERVMPGAHWFPGARVNYAQEMLRRAPADAPALIAVAEDGPPRPIFLDELTAQVGALAATLRDHGVGRFGRVAALMPNVPEALIGLLATAAIGAIWTACAPDFGAQSVLDRFTQVEPKVLLAVDGYRFGGRLHDRRDVVDALRGSLPSLTLTVVLSRFEDRADSAQTLAWEAAIAEPRPLDFADV